MTIGANVSFGMPGDTYWPSVASIIILYLIVGPCTNLSWITFGKTIGLFLSSAKRLKVFNLIMAGLMASCLFFIW